MFYRILVSPFRVLLYAIVNILPNEQKKSDLNTGALRQVSTPSQATATTSTPPSTRLYAELKYQIQQQGLLEKQPFYYICKIALLLALFALSIAALVLVHPLWFQLLNAVFLALITTQLGLLGHEAGHRQIFRKTWKNDLIGLLAGNLLIGMSNGWWKDKHNQHHSHPNQQGLDPDIAVPILSMDGDDLFSKGKIQQYIIRHQAFFFFPALSLVAFDLQVSSVKFLLSKKSQYRALEIALLLLHFAAYLGVLIFFLGFWQAVVFVVVHQLCSGLYLGSIFAPNHKGMPVLNKESELGFLYRQVITARNVKAHPVVDFWYGGLNYQIEHHLFPSMPRNRLREAQKIVRTFCQEHEIPYYETSMLQSYREILRHMDQVGAPLRAAYKAD